jgi:hypothetical protein
MKTQVLSSVFAVGAFSLLPISDAKAALISAAPPLCLVTDVTANATACSGSWRGNDANKQTDVLAELANLSSLTGWSLIGKSDDASNGPFTSNPQVTSGTLTFDSAVTGPFAIALKASNSFSLYYFLNDGSPISALNFIMNGTALNGRGNPQDLSHASLYRVGSSTVIPTPALLPGLLGMGLAALRKRKQTEA